MIYFVNTISEPRCAGFTGVANVYPLTAVSSDTCLSDGGNGGGMPVQVMAPLVDRRPSVSMLLKRDSMVTSTAVARQGLSLVHTCITYILQYIWLCVNVFELAFWIIDLLIL